MEEGIQGKIEPFSGPNYFIAEYQIMKMFKIRHLHEMTMLTLCFEFMRLFWMANLSP
jgi:hypothetical protein